MANRRVVVTGMGAVTPIGNDVKTYWEGLVSGKCGIDFVTRLKQDGLKRLKIHSSHLLCILEIGHIPVGRTSSQP